MMPSLPQPLRSNSIAREGNLEPEEGERGGAPRRGLGGLMRGRQTVDRAERFLLLFHGYGGSLSSDDKAAPVVQTIARHAAVILQHDPRKPASCFGIILYAARSALVHAGRRNVATGGEHHPEHRQEEALQDRDPRHPAGGPLRRPPGLPSTPATAFLVKAYACYSFQVGRQTRHLGHALAHRRHLPGARLSPAADELLGHHRP